MAISKTSSTWTKAAAMLPAYHKWSDGVTDFRETRIGIANAARILNVRVSELKDAIRYDKPLYGVMLPKPIGYMGRSRTEMYFYAGEIMDSAEAINKNRRMQSERS